MEPLRDGAWDRAGRVSDDAGGSGERRVPGGTLDVLQGNGGRQVHTADGHGGPGTDGGGSDPIGARPRPVSPGPADIRQRGRGQQLRARLPHGGPVVPGTGAGEHSAVRRVQRGRARVHRVPLDGRRHGVGPDQPGVGEPAPGLREEEQPGGARVPGAQGVHGRGGAVQRYARVAQDAGHDRLRVHGGQRGDIRHQRRQVGRGTAHVPKPEPHHQPGGVVHHRVAAVPGHAERRHQRVPDQPGAVPASALPAAGVRSVRDRPAVRAPAASHRRPDRRLFRAWQPAVQTRRERTRRQQVHRVLHAVPR